MTEGDTEEPSSGPIEIEEDAVLVPRVVTVETAARLLADRFGALFDANYLAGKTRSRETGARELGVSILVAEELCDELERAGRIRFVGGEDGAGWPRPRRARCHLSGVQTSPPRAGACSHFTRRTPRGRDFHDAIARCGWHGRCRRRAAGDCMAPREHDRFHHDGLTLGVGMTPETSLSRTTRETSLSAPRGSPRTGWTYLGHAAVHPSNLLLLIGVVFLSLILWNAPVLFVGLGVEGAFLCLVPRLGFFRSRIDEMLDEADRAAATKAREALVQQMSEPHRQELSRIEALMAKAVANVERRGGVTMGLSDQVGRSDLAESYIQLAIAHRACEESLAMTNRHVLEGTLRSLEAAEASSPDRARELVRRRLSIAYRRAERWARTREDLEAIGHQLATISELVQLVHQDSLAPLDAGGVGDAIDRVLCDFDESCGALREVDEISAPRSVALCEVTPSRAALPRKT